MQRLGLTLLIALIGVFAACSSSPKGDKAETSEAGEVAETTGSSSVAVNTETSHIHWTGSKVAGSHNGTINLKDGSIAMADGTVAGGSFTIDMSTIVNEDLPDDKKGDLVGHLMSPDFFDVENHPTAAFEITKVTALEGDEEASHMVYGNLTIKGITKQIGFRAAIKVDGDRVAVSTPDFTIDRTEFDVKYGSNKFFDNLKDNVINDNIGLSIELNS